MTFPDRDLNHLYPAFKSKILCLIIEWNNWAKVHMPGYILSVAEVFRSAEYQQSLYAQGRTKPGCIVTNADGIKNLSNHQSALAVDFVPTKEGKTNWDDSNPGWNYLGHLARKYDLEWGGDWHSIKDLPHVQWKATDRDTYKKAREWIKNNFKG